MMRKAKILIIQVPYARLVVDLIGYVDPKRLLVTEHDSPVKGPRRLRYDAAGNMWLTGYHNGEIARVNTETMESRVYPLPEPAPGYSPAPYVLGVHPTTREIWVSDPSTGRVFSFARSGRACTANSPIMNAGLEEGVAGFICIDVDGAGS